MKYIYTFGVNAFYTYDIEASTEKKARDILIEKGGYDINGELHLSTTDYQEAILMEKSELAPF